jgi:tetratricopeptide (TPR) repeat protein
MYTIAYGSAKEEGGKFMRAHASVLGGFCAFSEGETTEMVSVVDMSRIAPEISHLVCGGIDDWEVVEAPDRATLLKNVATRHTAARALANVELCLVGLSEDLRKELLGEVEDSLRATDIQRPLLSMLLRAPLQSDDELTLAIECSLTLGLAAIASLLEEVRESQPLLRRVADRWLSLPEELFNSIAGGRQRIWRLAVAGGVVLDSLEVATPRELEQIWARLAFDVSAPSERIVLTRLSKAVARTLFPEFVYEAEQTSVVAVGGVSEESEEEVDFKPRNSDPQMALQRALKQVDSITTAVAGGYDARARQYLNELVKGQLAFSMGENHAVKSLCNIAQQCAEMFRTDFEYECLQKAIQIKPNDDWTLIQLADHYKRVGCFADAISTLMRTTSSGNDTMSRASLADVYVQMRRFEDALAIYDSIPEGEHDGKIRGAKADLLRHWGRIDEAKREYIRIIEDGLCTDRVKAGQAEIAKREGNLAVARELYIGLVASERVDEVSAVIYRMALANILVRMGELKEAYRHVDDAVQKRPFARQPRAFRAAIAGLLGKPEEALRDLPRLGQTNAFYEWVNEYIRGLLLLLLNRYEDAHAALFQEFERRFLDGDADVMLRLGAAVCFLRDRAGVENAAQKLAEVPATKDVFVENIRAALAYHVAMALHEEGEIQRLEGQLRSIEDPDIKALIYAIRARDWKIAWNFEVRALLRLRPAA